MEPRLSENQNLGLFFYSVLGLRGRRESCSQKLLDDAGQLGNLGIPLGTIGRADTNKVLPEERKKGKPIFSRRLQVASKFKWNFGMMGGWCVGFYSVPSGLNLRFEWFNPIRTNLLIFLFIDWRFFSGLKLFLLDLIVYSRRKENSCRPHLWNRCRLNCATRT